MCCVPGITAVSMSCWLTCLRCGVSVFWPGKIEQPTNATHNVCYETRPRETYPVTVPQGLLCRAI